MSQNSRWEAGHIATSSQMVVSTISYYFPILAFASLGCRQRVMEQLLPSGISKANQIQSIKVKSMNPYNE